MMFVFPPVVCDTACHMGLDIKRIARNRSLYLIFLPGCIYYIVFRYIPMFGLVVAFHL